MTARYVKVIHNPFCPGFAHSEWGYPNIKVGTVHEVKAVDPKSVYVLIRDGHCIPSRWARIALYCVEDCAPPESTKPRKKVVTEKADLAEHLVDLNLSPKHVLHFSERHVEAILRQWGRHNGLIQPGMDVTLVWK